MKNLLLFFCLITLSSQSFAAYLFCTTKATHQPESKQVAIYGSLDITGGVSIYEWHLLTSTDNFETVLSTENILWQFIEVYSDFSSTHPIKLDGFIPQGLSAKSVEVGLSDEVAEQLLSMTENSPLIFSRNSSVRVSSKINKDNLSLTACVLANFWQGRSLPSLWSQLRKLESETK